MTRLPRQLENLARLLAYALCRQPDEFGVVLDADGFVPIKALLQALMAEPGWGFVRRHHLEQVVNLLQPPSLEIAGEQIRCLDPGPAQLRRPPGETPPALLYLAIPPKAHARVFEDGLQPPLGQELLLAATKETALKFGRRRAPQPVLVTVQAQAAARKGITFQGYGEALFLAPALPREFLQLPTPPPAPEKPKKAAPPPPPPVPGGFYLDLSQMQPKPPRPRGKKAEPEWKAGARALRKKRRREE
jgi:putative RNA 2'-phosphotransferase